MSVNSTREKLLSIIDDMELIIKELFENWFTRTKPKRLSAEEHQEYVDLLIAKDAELKAALALAEEQGRVQEEIERAQREIDGKDEAIAQLVASLREAESLLSKAVFQAKQKLSMIDKAKESPVSSEELIRYAHRISAANAVGAPLNWQQGDPRRPYPTDVEMRQGFLGRSEMAAVQLDRTNQATMRPQMQQQQQQQQQATPTHQGEFHSPSPFGAGGSSSQHHSPTKAMPGGSGFAWQGGSGGGELGGMMSREHPMEGGSSQQQQDVEVMSTDSSSSSSTDSN